MTAREEIEAALAEAQPTDEQRAEWQDAIATDLNGLDWWERRNDLIDAIFAAGAKAALDGMTEDTYLAATRHRDGSIDVSSRAESEYTAETFPDLYTLMTRRVTDWQAADDA